MYTATRWFFKKYLRPCPFFAQSHPKLSHLIQREVQSSFVWWPLTGLYRMHIVSYLIFLTSHFSFLSHSTQALVPLPILKHPRQAPTSGPLHWFPLSGIVFLQLSTWLALSLPSGLCSKVIYSLQVLKTNLLKVATVPTLLLFIVGHNIYLFVCLSLSVFPHRK